MNDLIKSQPVTDLDNLSAQDYFLKSESYCNIDLPVYYDFQKILDDVNNIYTRLSSQNSKFADYTNSQVRDLDGVNHHIYANKNGDLSWRDFQIIHPLLYVHLLSIITAPQNWNKILSRFCSFQSNDNIQCLSIPRKSLTNESDKAEQISNWWRNIEQKSIELALEYDYLYDTDIADCYGSIYTHSIAWAIETKEVAKQNKRDKTLLGNQVDAIVQTMQQGQTNGIPQGSNLMDFIAEIVLGYIDERISSLIQIEGIEDYKIIRYRDDYRIFVNNPTEGTIILKIISESLLDLGMRLNSSKTRKSDDVISTAIKSDKLIWLSKNTRTENSQHKILLIREHSKEHPNSGTLKKELKIFYDNIDDHKVHSDSLLAIISIVTNICYNNPSTYTVCFAIISKLLNVNPNDLDKNSIIKIIYKKFRKIPNTGFMQIWFRRIMKDSRSDIVFTEKLCTYLDTPQSIWNNSWIDNPSMKKILDSTSIIDANKLNSLEPIIQSNEFSLFKYNDAI